MSKTPFDRGEAERLAKIAGLFGSDHAGERASAAAKADALVRQLGLTWHDVISGASERQPGVAAFRPAWRQMADTCAVNAYRLSPREAEFIRDMQRARRQPSEKQLDWLTSIYERIDDVGRWAEDR